MGSSPARRRFILSWTFLIASLPSGYLETQDCNRNGIDDALDVLPGPRIFEGERLFSTLPGVQAIEMGDFDGDGVKDLVARSSGPGLTVHLLSPDMRSDRRLDLLPGRLVTGAVVGDFDGDSHLDLASYQKEGTPIIVHLGQGDGSFVETVGYQAGLGNFDELHAADLDGNGTTDLLLTRHDATTGVILPLRAQGDGTFAVTSPLRAGPRRLFIRDLLDYDRDGQLDLLVSNCRGGTESLVIYLGDGEFGFEELFEVSTRETGRSDCLQLIPRDLDGDGRLDILAYEEGSAGLHLFRSTPGGDLSAPTLLRSEVDLEALHAADLDGDGREDLVAITESEIVTYRGLPGPEFEIVERQRLPFEPWISRLRDLDGDGQPELILWVRSLDAIQVLKGLGDFRYALQRRTGVPFPSSAGFERVSMVDSGDLDGDGSPDLVTGTLDGPIQVFPGRPDGGYDPAIDVYEPPGGRIQDLVVLDVVGDGRAEILLTSVALDEMRILGTEDFETFTTLFLLKEAVDPIRVLPSRSPGRDRPDLLVFEFAGRFQLLQEEVPGEGLVLTAEAAFSFAPEGFRTFPPGDGQPGGVLALDRQTRAIEILFREESEIFGQVYVSLDEIPVDATMGDLDGDGILDLVVIVDTEPGVQIHFGRSPQEFEEPVGVSAGLGTSGVEVADLDLDGHLDVITTNRFGDGDGFSDFTWLRGRGDGTFEERIHLRSGEPGPFRIVDLRGDPAPEILHVDRASGGVAIIDNFRAPPFSEDANANGIPDECEGGTAFVRGDSNSDGEVDLSDAIFSLRWKFLGKQAPACLRAADVDDDGAVELADTTRFLDYFFYSTAPPPEPPFLACGLDTTADELSCEAHDPCD